MNPIKPVVIGQDVEDKPPMPSEGLLIVKDSMIVGMISDMEPGDALMCDPTNPTGFSLVKINQPGKVLIHRA